MKANTNRSNENITINGNVNVTINAGEAGEGLITNDTSFNDLLRILMTKPEAEAAASTEAEERAREARQRLSTEMFGEYASADEESATRDALEDLRKARRRPGAVQLRTGIPRIAKIDFGSCGLCEAFSNGYAVYDNGDRKTVLWIPDCGSFTYQFTALKDSELEYQKQDSVIDQDLLGPLPWHYAVMLAGEESIERNLSHPRSKGTVSDFDEEEWNSVTPASHWVAGTHFDGPEEAYLKKEAEEERRNALTEKQREAYVLYYEEGYSQYEIADKLGLSQKAVDYRLQGANKKLSSL